MAPFLRSFASATTRCSCGITRLVFRAVWLVSVVLGTLSSCSRATYGFGPSAHAYLATEQPAPSVPMLAVPPATRTDSLPAAASPRLPEAALQQRSNMRRPTAATHAGGRLTGPLFLTTELVTKHLSARPATQHRPHNAAHHAGTAGVSGTLVAALCLLGAGLLGVLIGAGISTNIVGAIFGVFLLALGSVALVAGLILLLVALLADE